MTATDRAEQSATNASPVPRERARHTPSEERPAVPALLYRVDEAAEALRLSRSSIYELIRSGQLLTVKHGSRRLVPVAALDDFVRNLAQALS